MPILRSVVKRKAAIDQPVETAPALKKQRGKQLGGSLVEGSAKPLDVKFAEPETLHKHVLPRRSLTSSKSESEIHPGRIRSPAASATQSQKSSIRAPTPTSTPTPPRTRTRELTPLPTLGTALKQNWDANVSAGGHSFPPEWDAKAHYHDGHVFSDGTFVEDGQLCKPLSDARKPKQPFRPIARPKSNFAAYEALFDGDGPSRLKGTRGPVVKDDRDLLPQDLEAKLRASLGTDLGMDYTEPSATRNKSYPAGRRQRGRPGKPATGWESVVARTDKASAGLGDQYPNTRNQYRDRRRKVPQREQKLASSFKGLKEQRRSRAGAVSSGNQSASAPGRRKRADAIGEKMDNPLASLLAEAEIRVDQMRTAQATAREGGKENPFERVMSSTTPKRTKQFPVMTAEPWDEQKRKRVLGYMRRQLLGSALSELGAEKRVNRKYAALDAELKREEAEVMKQNDLAQRARWQERTRAMSEQRITETLEERELERQSVREELAAKNSASPQPSVRRRAKIAKVVDEVETEDGMSSEEEDTEDDDSDGEDVGEYGAEEEEEEDDDEEEDEEDEEDEGGEEEEEDEEVGEEEEEQGEEQVEDEEEEDVGMKMEGVMEEEETESETESETEESTEEDPQDDDDEYVEGESDGMDM
ncbi:hypothetical protein MMC26_000212 [Xylographa opegraphella]|nr:hypothetical protein [Xylographa opegraphella]